MLFLTDATTLRRRMARNQERKHFLVRDCDGGNGEPERDGASGPGTTPVYRFLAGPRPVHRQEHHTLPGPRRLRPERPKRVLTLVIVKVQFAPRPGALGHRNRSNARHEEALVRPKRGSVTEPPSSALGHQRPGSALRAVRTPNFHIPPGDRRDLVHAASATGSL